MPIRLEGIVAPNDLPVTTWGADGSSIRTLRQVLNEPVTVDTPLVIHKGPGFSAGDTVSPLTRFSFPFGSWWGGHGIDELGRLARAIATHLAARRGSGWSDVDAAELWLLPITDFALMYELRPEGAGPDARSLDELLPPEWRSEPE